MKDPTLDSPTTLAKFMDLMDRHMNAEDTLKELKTESVRRMVGEIKREENRDSQPQTKASKQAQDIGIPSTLP